MAAPNLRSGRGVYRADFLSGAGNAVFLAITSGGRRAGELEVSGDMTEACVTELLAAILAHADPLRHRPGLHLHR